MFNNPGSKIKILAKVLYIIEAISAVITGVSLITIDEDMALIGLLVMVAGPVVAWVLSLLLYGFGEAIEKLRDIEKNTTVGERKSEAQTKLDLERINRIEKLRSQGLITEEEYRQAISKEQ